MRDLFQNRHIGISEEDRLSMLNAIGVNTLDQLISQTIPADIRLSEALYLPEAMTEAQFLRHISELGSRNELFHSLIGTGWYNTLTPSVILRNIFENASWYTSYTPYQAEISQGRLEALLNFQTAVTEFTGLPVANASLLDEATAAAEAATMMYNLRSRDQVKAGVNKLFVDEATFPQTLAVLRTRTKAQGINLVIEIMNRSLLAIRFLELSFSSPMPMAKSAITANLYPPHRQKESKLRLLPTS